MPSYRLCGSGFVGDGKLLGERNVVTLLSFLMNSSLRQNFVLPDALLLAGA